MHQLFNCFVTEKYMTVPLYYCCCHESILHNQIIMHVLLIIIQVTDSQDTITERTKNKLNQ